MTSSRPRGVTRLTSRQQHSGFQDEEARHDWRNVLTAVRRGAHEVGEAVVDSQALRILDQEIRDADDELHRSREALAGIMAKQKLAAERVARLQAQVTEYEGYALKALEADNETLAREVAEKIAALEAQLGDEREQANGYASSVAQLRKAITQAEGNLKDRKSVV